MKLSADSPFSILFGTLVPSLPDIYTSSVGEVQDIEECEFLMWALLGKNTSVLISKYPVSHRRFRLRGLQILECTFTISQPVFWKVSVSVFLFLSLGSALNLPSFCPPPFPLPLCRLIISEPVPVRWVNKCEPKALLPTQNSSYFHGSEFGAHGSIRDCFMKPVYW